MQSRRNPLPPGRMALFPFWDPFKDYYSSDKLHRWSRFFGGISRDAILMALIPNLNTWARNPFLYELGSTTVPARVWAEIETLSVFERGRWLWGNYGLTGFLWPTTQFKKTIGYGVTPGGWILVVLGVHGADAGGLDWLIKVITGDF